LRQNYGKMSTWITIEDQDDVEYDSPPLSEATIDVLISDDQFGNNYVSIPVEFILNVLKDNGYGITINVK
jgi:hypothetical protein